MVDHGRASDMAHLIELSSLGTPEVRGLRSLVDPAVPVVTYCWGPGCNGATKAALALSQLGYRVREMIGGIEYWIREGHPVEGRRPVARGEGRPSDWGLVS